MIRLVETERIPQSLRRSYGVKFPSTAKQIRAAVDSQFDTQSTEFQSNGQQLKSINCVDELKFCDAKVSYLRRLVDTDWMSCVCEYIDEVVIVGCADKMSRKHIFQFDASAQCVTREWYMHFITQTQPPIPDRFSRWNIFVRRFN